MHTLWCWDVINRPFTSFIDPGVGAFAAITCRTSRCFSEHVHVKLCQDTGQKTNNLNLFNRRGFGKIVKHLAQPLQSCHNTAVCINVIANFFIKLNFQNMKLQLLSSSTKMPTVFFPCLALLFFKYCLTRTTVYSLLNNKKLTLTERVQREGWDRVVQKGFVVVTFFLCLSFLFHEQLVEEVPPLVLVLGPPCHLS